jgi:hypothetical protein
LASLAIFPGPLAHLLTVVTVSRVFYVLSLSSLGPGIFTYRPTGTFSSLSPCHLIPPCLEVGVASVWAFYRAGVLVMYNT